MLFKLNFLLVTVACCVSACTAIRVFWNTNTGPIIPPTPRTTPRPALPFREPAPVWEDFSNDISNPNPYVYIPPPPSRPKQRLNTNVNYNNNDSNSNSSGKNYGTIVRPQTSNTNYQQNNNNNNNNNNLHQVSSLSPQYVPNIGTKYVAVVPTSIITATSIPANKYPQNTLANALSPDNKTSYKLQGKYNSKTKKYKAYEKVKYVPLNYYSSLNSYGNSTAAKSQLLGGQKLNQLNLPAENHKNQWPAPSSYINTSPTAASQAKIFSSKNSYTNHMNAKNNTPLTAKKQFNDTVEKAKKS